MKETKVYVKELPKSCAKCLFCYDNRPYWKSTDCIINYKELDEDEIETKREKDCPLIDIKAHDRELVKEVCEKIRNNVNDMPYYDDRTGYVSPTDVCEMIDELQKEYEK